MTKKWWTFFVTLMLLCSLSASACAAGAVYALGIADAIGKKAAQDQLNLGVLVDKDLNDGAGGHYIYMAYNAAGKGDDDEFITGIRFFAPSSSDSPPETMDFKGTCFYLLGGSHEKNFAKDTDICDLNNGAGGRYIYTYITKDPDYGPAIAEIGVCSKDHPYVLRNFSDSYVQDGYGYPQDLNEGCEKLVQDVPSIYLYAKPFEATLYGQYHYLDELATKQVANLSPRVQNPAVALLPPAVPSRISYKGYEMTLQGWAPHPSTFVLTSYMNVEYYEATTAESPKVLYAIYACTPKITYDANGGSNAPAAQELTTFQLSASGMVTSRKTLTITSAVPTHENSCYEFLGWSTDPNATEPDPMYAAGASVDLPSDITLYAVWQPHHYGALIPAQPETHTKDTLKPGTSAYYQCTKCMGYFNESKQPTTIFDLLGETPVHTFEDSVCTECGYVITVGGTRSHVVIYDANGGTGSMLPQLFTSGVAQRLTANTFTRPGYTFIGWNTAADGSGTAYRKDTNLTISRSITLYAQWQAIEGWVDPPTVNLPKTGDSSTPMLWLTMSILSMLGILLLRKKVYSR